MSFLYWALLIPPLPCDIRNHFHRRLPINWVWPSLVPHNRTPLSIAIYPARIISYIALTIPPSLRYQESLSWTNQLIFHSRIGFIIAFGGLEDWGGRVVQFYECKGWVPGIYPLPIFYDTLSRSDPNRDNLKNIDYIPFDLVCSFFFPEPPR